MKSQATRSRSQNRKIARELLAQRLDEHLHGEESRSSLVGSIKKKKADSAAKKSRRKYKKLEEGKNASGEATETAEQERDDVDLDTEGEKKGTETPNDVEESRVVEDSRTKVDAHRDNDTQRP